MTESLVAGSSWLALHWWLVLIVCILGIAPMCARARTRRDQKKQLRALADKILIYGRSVHKHFPTGEVVVGEGDLAERLWNRSDAVIAALNLLLDEQKVQRAPLTGYWKLNV